MINTICVTGAGTMGNGIAQAAAQSGFSTLLFDVSNASLDKARQQINQQLQQLVQKQKITQPQANEAWARLSFTNNINDCKAPLVIEAIIEKMEAKITLFNQLSHINSPHTIFATNTSALSITSIQQQIPHPQRVAGMHFFNPATIMKLVELVQAPLTSDAVINKLQAVCSQMNKVSVVCKDAPGFIVNRVARHYYLEALKMVEQGLVSIQQADEIMEASGFKMGPFKLMDLIGMDINLAVSKNIYEAFNQAQRFAPSALQIQKVNDGALGRKTGKGFYQYT
ncbi:MAG: hypothetical protein RL172_762 [Bacteroidota bacterium]